MIGAKRFFLSESNQDAGDSALWNKRAMPGSGSLSNIHRAESPHQQLMETPQLDVHRAESSRQHVKALNSQFASWVETQLKNHPDELWEDGIQDYLTHASNIMEKYSDVVQWLKAKALKEDNLAGTGFSVVEKNVVSEIKNNEVKISPAKSGFAPVGSGASFGMSWGSGGSSSVLGSIASQSPPVKNEIKHFQGNSLFASVGTTTSSSTSWSFGGTSSTVGSSPSEKAPVSRLFHGKPQSSPAGTTTGFGTPWSSGVFSNSQTPAFFGSQGSVPVNHDADDENDLEQPSSPSVKKSEEKGIVVVHEVKCKLYVKSNDPNDKDTWKDKGAGKLSIKCQEGLSKGTKESKPIILIRNDVGKILLNASIYQGIRTNAKKKSIVAIFHTSGDGDDDSVVARTFLFRLKTEEDRMKLETAIKEYAPQA